LPLDGRDTSTLDIGASDDDDKMFSTLRDFRAIKTGRSSDESICSKTFSTAVFTLLTAQHDKSLHVGYRVLTSDVNETFCQDQDYFLSSRRLETKTLVSRTPSLVASISNTVKPSSDFRVHICYIFSHCDNLQGRKLKRPNIQNADFR